MLVDFRVICMEYLWLPCSYAGFTNQIISSTLSETSSFRGSQTFNKCDASVRDEVKRVPHVKGAQFWLPAVLLSIYIRLEKRAVLAWRKFPICHYSQHASFTFSPLLSDLPVSRSGGHLRTILWSKCVHRSVSLNQPKPQRCSQASCSHFTHCEPGTTVAADVRIWLLGQLFESEETRFLIAINH